MIVFPMPIQIEKDTSLDSRSADLPCCLGDMTVCSSQASLVLSSFNIILINSHLH